MLMSWLKISSEEVVVIGAVADIQGVELITIGLGVNVGMIVLA